MTRRRPGWAGALTGASAALALAYLVLSLAWPPLHDLRVLLYEGFLVFGAGKVPYRDLFDVNPPGTFLLFGAIDAVTGGEHAAIRLLDYLVLAGIMTATLAALRRHGRAAGIFAAATFAAAYFSTGPTNALQREYLCLLPLALSLALVFGLPDRPRHAGRVLLACGLLAGLAGNIKPPLALCWLPLLGYAAVVVHRQRGGRALAAPALLFAAGAILPVALVGGWLDRHGALGAYLEMARSYYPLYTRIDGFGVTFQPGLHDLLERWLWRPGALLLERPLSILAVLALVLAGRLGEPRLRAERATLAALAGAALLYLPVSGKFWVYHQVPLFYALALCAALAFSPEVAATWSGVRWQRAALAAGALACLPWAAFAKDLATWREGRVDALDRLEVLPLADYLRHETKAGDTVAPLDTTEGALHALYLVRRPLYGRFLNDFHFYHDSDRPYIQELRREFLAQFHDGRPSVLLRCKSWRPQVLRESDRFLEFQELLARDYVVVREAGDCAVLRHR